VTSDDKAEEYLKSVEERENIYLDPSKIAKNPGKRALAKLMLNSFWGKVNSIFFVTVFIFECF